MIALSRSMTVIRSVCDERAVMPTAVVKQDGG
jgi:hypothetical protein